MDLALVIASLAFVISLAALCAWGLLLFQRTRDPDVEELAAQVVSLRKSHRAEQMRRVRETPPTVTPDPGGDAPPGFVAEPVARLSKDELRKMVFGGEPTRRH